MPANRSSCNSPTCSAPLEQPTRALNLNECELPPLSDPHNPPSTPFAAASGPSVESCSRNQSECGTRAGSGSGSGSRSNDVRSRNSVNPSSSRSCRSSDGQHSSGSDGRTSKKNVASAQLTNSNAADQNRRRKSLNGPDSTHHTKARSPMPPCPRSNQ